MDDSIFPLHLLQLCQRKAGWSKRGAGLQSKPYAGKGLSPVFCYDSKMNDRNF